MKTRIKELGSTQELVISDDMMDNENFVTIFIQNDEVNETEWMEIEVLIDELLRAVK